MNDLRARADRGEFGIVDNDYSWLDLKREFLRMKRQTAKRPKEYEQELAKFEEYGKVQSIRQITTEWVRGFRSWRLEQGVTPRTVNRQVGVLSHMLNQAVEWQRIGSNPIAGLKPLPHDALAKERRALSIEEIEAILEASPEYLRPAWRMFVSTGMRKDELVPLTFDDVDFQRRTVTVRAEHAKNHKPREIPLDDEMLATIRELRDQAEHREPAKGYTAKQTAQQAANFSREHVFVTKANTPWRNNLLTKFYAVCRKAGIDDAEPGGAVDIHSLRVSFATVAIENGASPKAIQAILGHSSLALTMNIYSKATDRAKRDAVDALPFGNVSAPDGVIAMPNEHAARTSKKDATQPVKPPRLA